MWTKHKKASNAWCRPSWCDTFWREVALGMLTKTDTEKTYTFMYSASRGGVHFFLCLSSWTRRRSAVSSPSTLCLCTVFSLCHKSATFQCSSEMFERIALGAFIKIGCKRDVHFFCEDGALTTGFILNEARMCSTSNNVPPASPIRSFTQVLRCY